MQDLSIILQMKKKQLDSQKSQYFSHKTTELLVKYAEESGKNSFKILLNFGDDRGYLSILQWCEDEYNFVGLCVHPDHECKTTYTLRELPNVIDRALGYTKQCWEVSSNFVAMINIMAL